MTDYIQIPWILGTLALWYHICIEYDAIVEWLENEELDGCEILLRKCHLSETWWEREVHACEWCDPETEAGTILTFNKMLFAVKKNEDNMKEGFKKTW